MNDLLFQVQIDAVAKRHGLSVEYLQQNEALYARIAQQPSLLIFDLSFRPAKSLEAITFVKSHSPSASTFALAFVSHVNIDLRKQAEEAGCDMVVARSVFIERLSGLLRDLCLSAGEVPQQL